MSDSEAEKTRIDDIYRKMAAFSSILSMSGCELETDVVKRRFDDAYRTIVSVSGIFAFAFANYAMGPFNTFIYKVGIPFILTAVVIWPIAHIFNRSWEFKAKFVGLFLAWFATIGLLSIVYLKDLVGTYFGYTGWLVFDFLITMSIIPVVGSVFVSAKIVSKRYSVLMLGIGTFISLGAYLLVISA